MAGYFEESGDTCSNSAIDIRELLYVKTDEGDYRGWRVDILVEKITSDLESTFLTCGACKGLLRDACLFENEGKDQEFRCSDCMPDNVKRQRIQHNQQIIDKKQVECPFKLKGCEWKDVIGQIHSHLSTCDSFPVLCPLGCLSDEEKDNGQIYRIERKLLEEHQNTLCPMRQITCDFCMEGVRACEMNNHLNDCEEFTISCPNECDSEERANQFKRKLLPSHLEECPLEEVDCPYSNYGCVTRKKRKLMDRHESENVNTHFKLAMTGMEMNQTNLLNRIEKLENELSEKNKTIQDLGNTTFTLETKGTLEWKITDVKKKIEMKDISISDFFYMGSYKFLCRVQWDFGNKGNVACFISLLKGENDDGLAWPVRFKCRIILINRFDNAKSHEKSHTVTNNDLKKIPKCFSQPKETENEAYGWSDFITQTEILKPTYTQDDSIILKVHLKQLPW